MDYSEIKYEIIPKDVYKIKRMCAGCGKKQIFISKDNFRVNANGKNLDVWMIYGCEKCNHTYNLPIYERVDKSKIPKSDYLKFLSNGKDMIFKIGTDKEIYLKNKAEIERKNIKYDLVALSEHKDILNKNRVQIILVNSYNIPVRLDKIAADILETSRKEAKIAIDSGNVIIRMEVERF